MRVLTPAALIAMFIWTAAAAQEAGVSLRPKWEEGQTSTYHFWTTRTQSQTVSARGQTRSNETRVATEGDVTWRVERAKPDGSYTCAMTLDWMTADLTAADGTVYSNDSRRSTGDLEPYHNLLRAMAGVPLTVEVAADGRITGVSNVAAMRQRFKGEEFPIEDLDFIESATDLATIAGAPAQLRSGGSWNIDFRWTHELGHIEQDTTYRLVGVEDIEGIPVATVEGEARTRLDVDPSELPEQQAGGPTFDVRLVDSDYEAQVMFDLVRHEAVGRNSVDTRTIETTIRLPQGAGTITQRTVETIHSQTLRIAEE